MGRICRKLTRTSVVGQLLQKGADMTILERGGWFRKTDSVHKHIRRPNTCSKTKHIGEMHGQAEVFSNVWSETLALIIEACQDSCLLGNLGN